MDKPIEVPMQVYEGIEAIRKRGVDLKDYQSVMDAAVQLGFQETENWLHDNVKIYIQGVRYGILPEGHTSESCCVQLNHISGKDQEVIKI